MRLICAIFLVIACSGCFVVQVERPVAAGEQQIVRKHFFLLGRIGEHEVDLAKACPQGVSSFGDRFTVSDAAFAVLTAGIYTPRTVVFRCAL